jgi:hypothetical protein
LPIIVFDMNKKGNLMRVAKGEEAGTLISWQLESLMFMAFCNHFCLSTPLNWDFQTIVKCLIPYLINLKN